MAPRFLMIGSGSEDVWADPYSEQLCALAASPAWELLGLKGFLGGLRAKEEAGKEKGGA